MRTSFFASLVILATTTAVSAAPIEARNGSPVTFPTFKGGDAGSGYSGSVDGGNAINSGYSYVGNSAFASKCCLSVTRLAESVANLPFRRRWW